MRGRSSFLAVPVSSFQVFDKKQDDYRRTSFSEVLLAVSFCMSVPSVLRIRSVCKCKYLQGHPGHRCLEYFMQNHGAETKFRCWLSVSLSVCLYDSVCIRAHRYMYRTCTQRLAHRSVFKMVSAMLHAEFVLASCRFPHDGLHTINVLRLSHNVREVRSA